MALVQSAVLVLIALALAPGSLFYFDVTPKVAVLLVGAAASLLVGNRAPRWLSVLAAINAVSLTISAAASSNPALALTGTNWRRFGVVTQIALWIFGWGLAGRTVVILRGITIATAVASLYGIAQYFGWDPILPSAGYHVGEGVWTIVRPPGTLGYVSYFATWLAMAAFLAQQQASVETARAWRWLAWSTALVATIALALTGTRAAMLGLMAGGAVWAWRRGWRIPRRAALVVACLAVALAAFYASPAGWQLRSRARWFVEDPWGGGRLTLWRDSLRMAAARPMLGFGPETFTAEFPQYESKKLAAAYPDFAYESPHNILIEALIAQGIPGLLILGALCFAAFRQAWTNKTPWLAAALAAGFVSQQFTVFTAPTAALFFVTIAMACQTEGEGARRKYTALGLAPVALALLYCAIRLVAADHALALAKRGIDAGSPREASAHYQQYRRLRFPGASADLWYSRALLNLAPKLTDPARRIDALAQSGAAAIEATGTSEDPFNAWYNLAIQDATRNDAVGAERSLRAAIHSHPNWFKPHWTLSQVLRLEGRLEEAEREAALAIELDGGKHPEVSKPLQK